MDNYVTGATIKRLREKNRLTQAQLAEKISVSAKAVSKWETAKGLPDISLIEPLARALGVSITELMSGNTVINGNVSANMLRSKFYVCPVCGNVIRSFGDAFISCCGVTLPPIDADECDESHLLCIENSEDEMYITVPHDMTKEHYISFVSYLTAARAQTVKLYPESDAAARFKRCGRGVIYFYCNRHGLFGQKI